MPPGNPRRGKGKTGHVIIIRGGEDRRAVRACAGYSPTSTIMGKDLGRNVALITDGRSAAAVPTDFVIGHVTPDAEGARRRGEERGSGVIDAEKRSITLGSPPRNSTAACGREATETELLPAAFSPNMRRSSVPPATDGDRSPVFEGVLGSRYQGSGRAGEPRIDPGRFGCHWLLC